MIMWLLALTRVAADAVRIATEARNFENTIVVVDYNEWRTRD